MSRHPPKPRHRLQLRRSLGLLGAGVLLSSLFVFGCAQIQKNLLDASRSVDLSVSKMGHNLALDRTGTMLGSRGTAIGAAIVKAAKGMGAWSKEMGQSLSRPAAVAMSPEQEYYLGRTVCAQVLSQRGDRLLGVRGEGKTALGSADLHYVQAVANALLPAVERSHPSNIGAEHFPSLLRVAVIPGEAPNAFSTPGGFILVTTGLLSLVRDEDELAAVLAHELAHVTLAHGLAAIDKAESPSLKLLQGGATLLSAGASATGVPTGKLSAAMDRFSDSILNRMMTGYGKRTEYAADSRAVAILAEAGYDPAALKRVLGELQVWQSQHGQDAGFAKTHPAPSDRLQRLGTVAVVSAPQEIALVRSRRFAVHAAPLVRAGVARASASDAALAPATAMSLNSRH